MLKKGFTLVEIIIAIVILGILTGFIVSHLNGGKEVVVKTKRTSDVEILKNAFISYRSENYNNNLPIGNDCVLEEGKAASCNFLEGIVPLIGSLPEPESGTEYRYSSDGTNCTISVKSTVDGSLIEGPYDCASTNLTPITDYPVGGVCGPANGSSYIEEPSPENLCISGNATELNYEEGVAWSWNCLGINGGASSSCVAYNSSSVFACRIVSDGECTVSEENSGDSSVLAVNLFNIYSLLGSHAEMPAVDAEYTHKVCCEGTNLTNECDGGTVLLRLHQLKNSHVEKSTSSEYTNNVCLSVPARTVSCEYANGACSEGYTCIVSISDGDTNLHVGGCEAYATKVCCKINTPE